MSLQFSEKGEEKFQEILGRYPETKKMAALLPVLLLAQSEFGWVSVEVMDYLAERLELHPAKVLSTATFYSMVNKQPMGKCHVQVCTTLSCALRGGYELLDTLEEQLGINTGETSSDGNWTLSEVECLASCGTAPMFQVTYSDGEIDYFEDLGDPDRLEAVLSELNAKLASLPDPRKMHDERRN
jgi:NADH-quinone oxidoreductase subunit E